jgi:hypothetical protein
MMIKSRGQIDYGTVQNMRHGYVPKKGIIVDFAITLGEDINYWLTLAGYEPIPTALVQDPKRYQRIRRDLEASGKLTPDEIDIVMDIVEENERIAERMEKGAKTPNH